MKNLPVNVSSNDLAYIAKRSVQEDFQLLEGRWKGEKGNGLFVPDDPECQAVLKQFGLDGIMYHHGVPDFAPVALDEEIMPGSMWLAKDSVQFAWCDSRALAKYDMGLIAAPDLQGDMIMQTMRSPRLLIGGCTWHHDVAPGRMLLVPTCLHRVCLHAGGRAKWGGGGAYR